MRHFCLNIHADYRCRHHGACCTAGWDIAAEPAVASALAIHFGRRAEPVFTHAGSPAMLAARDNGACVFLDDEPGRRCMVHRELGAALLPSACRHFPRVVVTDARGTFVTLSHFCPTAAALLFADRPVGRVHAPATLTLDRCVEGLDATAALPPLLRPGMLMDLDGYEAWERGAIRTLTCAGVSVDDAIASVAAATRDIQRWSPGVEPLHRHVARAFEQVDDCSPFAGATSAARGAGHWADVDRARDSVRDAMARAAVPEGLCAPAPPATLLRTREAVAAIWTEHDAVVRRYLASKLFANWYVWQGTGVATALEAIRVHAAVLRTEIARRLEQHGASREVMLESIRAADFLMVHLADSGVLAQRIDASLR